MARFDGKIALITGGVQGIGRATAQRLASEGAKIIVADRKNDLATLNSIKESGGEAIQVQMDVRSREDWNRTVESATDAFGRIDFLANVAGVVNMLSEDSVVGLTDEGWDYVMDINLRGTWLGMQAVIPQMQAHGGGRIVNISSASALRGMQGSAAYAASKAGVIGLTQQAARVYTQDNILINAICPGTTDTPIFGDDATEAFKQSLAEFHLIKRLGRPQEIAGKIAYFFSEDGSFSAGQTESVDGGWTINGHTT
ncbi:SDR family NAD(P)-dependent oxidoreductase [Rhodococcus koreensis]